MGRTIDFDGAFTAIATPFRNGELDFAALDRLLEHQIAGGIHGVVPVGTTGESPTLTATEQHAVIERTVATVKQRAFVIAGTGTNSTRETIERTRAAERAGADAAMIVMPYYNKPTQRGLVEHVRAVHDATQIPLVLYNVPPRTSVDLVAESVVEIAKHCPRVVAIKEATGNVVRSQQIVGALGDRLAVLSGDDALTLGILACGGRGVISVTSNVAPAAVQRVVKQFHAGDLAAARASHLALLPLHDAMFVETNPGPVKAALSMMGICAPEIRLPLAWPNEKSQAAIRAALQSASLL
jgi:4-hydroxy-tetrahydrodipicolinate synthase